MMNYSQQQAAQIPTQYHRIIVTGALTNTCDHLPTDIYNDLGSQAMALNADPAELLHCIISWAQFDLGIKPPNDIQDRLDIASGMAGLPCYELRTE